MSTKKDKFSKKDKTFMELALNLAKARHGLTGVNPSVGCVIVKNNEILSIGQTGFDGTPHAEFNAIKNSNENLEDAKMYVTLEPCSHYGKTPPCTNIIIKNKIKEVVYAVEDIDKKVKGKTLKILQSKNILVKKNLLKQEVNEFYTPYFELFDINILNDSNFFSDKLFELEILQEDDTKEEITFFTRIIPSWSLMPLFLMFIKMCSRRMFQIFLF